MEKMEKDFSATLRENQIQYTIVFLKSKAKKLSKRTKNQIEWIQLRIKI